MKTLSAKTKLITRTALAFAAACGLAACSAPEGEEVPANETAPVAESTFAADENTVVQQNSIIIDQRFASSNVSEDFNENRGKDMIKFNELEITANYTIEGGERSLALKTLGGRNSYDKKVCERSTNDYGDEVACTPDRAREEVVEHNTDLVERTVRQSINEVYDDIIKNCGAVDFELNADSCKAFTQQAIQNAFNEKVQLAQGAQTPVTITGVTFEVEFTPISRAMVEQKIHGVDRIQIVVNPIAPSN